MVRVLNVANELKTPKVIGVHGTSVEVALAILNKGKFDTEDFSRRLDRIKSDSIHFVANMEHYKEYFEKLGIHHETANADYMIEAASGWAREIAFRHYMAIQTNDTKPLGWHQILWAATSDLQEPIKYLNLEDIASEYEEFVKHLKSQNISEERLNELIREGYKRKGCLIGLNERCLELKIGLGDCDGDPEAKIIMPQRGLDLKYIRGIVPIGQVEREVLARY